MDFSKHLKKSDKIIPDMITYIKIRYDYVYIMHHDCTKAELQ